MRLNVLLTIVSCVASCVGVVLPVLIGVHQLPPTAKGVFWTQAVVVLAVVFVLVCVCGLVCLATNSGVFFGKKVKKELARLLESFENLQAQCKTQIENEKERKSNIYCRGGDWFFSMKALSNFADPQGRFTEFKAFEQSFKFRQSPDQEHIFQPRFKEEDKPFLIHRTGTQKPGDSDFDMILRFIKELQKWLGNDESLFAVSPLSVVLSREKKVQLHKMISRLKELRDTVSAACDGSPPPVNLDWFNRRLKITGDTAGEFNDYHTGRAERLGGMIAEQMFERQRVLFLNYPTLWKGFTGSEDEPGTIEFKRKKLSEFRTELQDGDITKYHLIVCCHYVQHLYRSASRLCLFNLMKLLADPNGKFIMIAAVSRYPEDDVFALEGKSDQRAFFLSPQLVGEWEKADVWLRRISVDSDIKVTMTVEKTDSAVLIQKGNTGSVVGSLLKLGGRYLFNLKRKMPEIKTDSAAVRSGAWREYRSVVAGQSGIGTDIKSKMEFEKLAVRFSGEGGKGTLCLSDFWGKKYWFSVFKLASKDRGGQEDAEPDWLKLAAEQLPEKMPFILCDIDYGKLGKQGITDYDPDKFDSARYRYETCRFKSDGNGEVSVTLFLEQNSAIDQDNYLILKLGEQDVYAGYYPVKQLIPEVRFNEELKNGNMDSLTHQISWRSLNSLLQENGLRIEKVFFHTLGPRAANSVWGREIRRVCPGGNIFFELEQKLNSFFGSGHDRRSVEEGLSRLEELDVHDVLVVASRKASKKGKSA